MENTITIQLPEEGLKRNSTFYRPVLKKNHDLFVDDDSFVKKRWKLNNGYLPYTEQISNILIEQFDNRIVSYIENRFLLNNSIDMFDFINIRNDMDNIINEYIENNAFRRCEYYLELDAGSTNDTHKISFLFAFVNLTRRYQFEIAHNNYRIIL